MSKVKVGIIGYGNMGTGHAQKILEDVPDMELTIVADIDPARREIAKKDLPESVAVVETGSDLIKSGKCDAIIIAVPHYDHPTYAIEGFENNLHVMVEKPAGVYTKQVQEMNKAAAKSDRVFGMMFNQRTNPLYRKMKELLDSGEMGEIKRVNWIITDWYRTQSYYDSGGWRATWEGEGGGVLLNQSPHQLDLIQWICGMPESVRAFCHNGKWHDIEVEDDVTAYLEYPNGATGVFITSTGDAPGTNRFEVTTNFGKMICENNELTVYKLDVDEREYVKTEKNGFKKPSMQVEKVEVEGENLQHIGILRAFAANILRGEPLVADGKEGINGLLLSNAMHLSSWLGETVELPIDEDLFLEKLNALRATSKAKDDVESVTFDTEGTY